MYRKLGIGILILCFGFSSVDFALADELIPAGAIGGAFDPQEISQQMLEQDRINKDQELAIKGLIEDNQKLAAVAYAQKQDSVLGSVRDSMVQYRDYLLAQDRARAAADLPQPSQYKNPVPDANKITDVSQILLLKSTLTDEKYTILMELKSEMVDLNEKLRERKDDQKFEAIANQQQEKVRELTQRLNEIDQKIAQYDGILVAKDQVIAQIRNNLIAVQGESKSKDKVIKRLEDKLQGQAQSSQQYKDQRTQQALDLKAKNESIRWLNQVLTATRNKAQYYQLSYQQSQLDMKQVQAEVRKIKDDFAGHFKDYEQLENDMVSLKSRVGQLGLQLSQKQAQVDLLKSELTDKLTEENNQAQQELQAEGNFKARLQDKEDQIAKMGALIKEIQQDQAKKDISEHYVEAQLNDHINRVKQLEVLEQNLKAQLQDKEDQMVKLRALIKETLQNETNKEISASNASAQFSDLNHLAKQLIALQRQQAALLGEKSDLWADGNSISDEHVRDLKNKIKGLLADHHTQHEVLQSRLEELKGELDQKAQQVEVLKNELAGKIAQEKNQRVLAVQIQDLKFQLQDQEAQVVAMKTKVLSGQADQVQADTLKQQMADQQNRADLLKQQLDAKNAQFDQMSEIIQSYQKKLEAKDSAYNEQLKQVLSYKNDQQQIQGQIADLNARLQDKEEELVNIKKNLYDLQKLTSAKTMDAQIKDLSFSMEQRKLMNDKVNELQNKIEELQATGDGQALAISRLKAQLAQPIQQPSSAASSDEADYLRTELQKTIVQLRQKDEMLDQAKANADEYAQEFKAQSQQLQSLTNQLQDARNGTLRLKGPATEIRGDEQEVGALREQLKQKDETIFRMKADADEYAKEFKAQSGEFQNLKDQLQDAQQEIENKDHRIKDKDREISRLKAQHPSSGRDMQTITSSQNDPTSEKLKQALDKIDQQAKVINVLVQKLQDAGQSVDLTKDYR